jgi:hypothetical protein
MDGASHFFSDDHVLPVLDGPDQAGGSTNPAEVPQFSEID